MAKKRKKTKAKKSKKAFLPKPTPAPLVPQPPHLPEQPLMFGGFFGNKTEGQ